MGLMTKRGSHKPRDMTLPSTHGYDPVFTRISGIPVGYVDASAFGVPIDVLGGGNLTESQHSNITQTKSQY
ncbi:hypothetical protein ATW60_12710 [Oenococcus oeni]|nr:hypothetical protein ATW60_12710 [Oenococcus oeni]